MRVVYGPVLSWRFGRSLGIDLISGVKACTFNCIYCQLGRTIVKVTNPEDFKEYVKLKNVKEELEAFIDKISLNDIDVVTFSGSGEPTLNPELKEITRQVKNIIKTKPLVILTNSSLIYSKKVQEALCEIDIVSAKLDAGDEKAFNIINRPYMKNFSVKSIVDSLRDFKSIYSGELMLQTMFLKTTFGFTNTKGRHFENLINAILKIEPEVVQVDTPYRPGGENYVKPIAIADLITIGEHLTSYFPKNKVWIFGVHDKRKMQVKWTSKSMDYESELLEVLKRRPLRLIDIANFLGIDIKTVFEVVEKLKRKSLIKEKEISGEIYYTIT